MRVMIASQHIGHEIGRNTKAVKRYHPGSVGMTEMDAGEGVQLRIAREIMAPEYRLCTQAKGGHSREVPIFFKRRPWFVFEGVTVIPLSPDLPDGLVRGLGNDRWLTIVRWRNRFRKHRRYFHLNTHLNAAIQSPSGDFLDHQRALTTISALQKIEVFLRKLHGEGRVGFVTGDLNWRRKGNSSHWFMAPENMFARTGMRYKHEGLDWMAWTKGWIIPMEIKVIDRGEGGNSSDHPWIVGDFKFAWGRKP